VIGSLDFMAQASIAWLDAFGLWARQGINIAAQEVGAALPVVCDAPD
jgi:hypothetical protein